MILIMCLIPDLYMHNEITMYKDGKTFCLLYPKSCLLDHHLNVKLFMPKL